MIMKQTIEISKKIKYHLLRHFEIISSDYRNDLMLSGYSIADINYGLTISGSKFCRKFATSPQEVIEKVLKNEQTLICENNRVEVSIPFSKTVYPFGVGTTNVVPLSELSKDEVSAIKKYPRSHSNPYLVNSVKRVKKELTCQVNLILGNRHGFYELITLFPGKIAPPIPNKAVHTTNEYKQFNNFWCNHAFLT